MSTKSKAMLFSIVTVVVIGMVPVRADTRYFTDATGDHKWNTQGNWKTACTGGDPGQVPIDGDHAVICEDKRCEVNIATARADSFEVRPGSETTTTLRILGSQALEIDSNSSVASNAVVEIATNATLKISGSLTLSGYGSVRGLNLTGRIEFTGAYDLAVASEATIEGAMEIRRATGAPPGFRLINDGLVHANHTTGGIAAQTLLLRDGTFRGSGEYKVSNHSDARLYLYSGMDDTGLAAKITVANGHLLVAESVTTTGHLTFTGGEITVTDNHTLTAGSP